VSQIRSRRFGKRKFALNPVVDFESGIGYRISVVISSKRFGDAFEYLLSVLGFQGDAGQFRTAKTRRPLLTWGFKECSFAEAELGA